MIFSRKSPIQKINEAADRQDLDKVAKILEEVVSKNGYDSEPVRELDLLMSMKKLPFLNFLIKFLESNQHFFGVHFRIAEIYAEMSHFDNATMEARNLLRRLHKTNQLVDPAHRKIATYCHHVMTAAYTESGARSYSKKLLQEGLKYSPPDDQSQRVLEAEFATLDRELLSDEKNELDGKWQEFFKTGKFAKELHEHCEKLEMPMLAKRVELIEENFRLKPDYSFVFVEEFLMEVYRFQDAGVDTSYTFVLR